MSKSKDEPTGSVLPSPLVSVAAHDGRVLRRRKSPFERPMLPPATTSSARRHPLTGPTILLKADLCTGA